MSPESDPQFSPTTDEGAPAAESVVTAQPEAGESGAQASDPNVVNDLFRAAAGQPTSKPVDGEPVGESAPQGDVKPTEGRQRGPDGRFLPQGTEPDSAGASDLGRRGSAAEIDRLRAENARLLAERQERDAQTAAAVAADDEAQARADAERYLHLRDLPETHPDLTDNDYEGWKWLEEQRQLRANYPKAQKALQAQLDAEVTAERQRLQQGHQATLNVIAQQMGRVGARFGVDVSELQKLGDFEQIANAITAPLLAEIAELRNEQQQARYTGARGLGSFRVNNGAGLSGPGAPPPDINDLFRAAANGRR